MGGRRPAWSFADVVGQLIAVHADLDAQRRLLVLDHVVGQGAAKRIRARVHHIDRLGFRGVHHDLVGVLDLALSGLGRLGDDGLILFSY